MYKEFRDNVEMLALNVIPQYSETEFLAYLDRYGRGDYFHATDSEQRIARAYGITYLGETVFIDRDGNIAERAYPPGLSYEELKQRVEPLLP